jgi:glutamine synthetase
MGSALLASFNDGLDNKIDPGPPENTNMYEAVAKGKVVKKLPLSLGEALDRLDEDEIIKGSMPDEMYRVFKHYKRDEWERFLGATTQWDIDTYMDCLP